MDFLDEIDLLDCPVCGGPAIPEEENGWCAYICCADCGCHTAEVDFDSVGGDKTEAYRLAAMHWNMGKVLSSDPGE